MSTPVITVLMPVYNAAKYLRASVESVLAQSFRDFELLIIDDGSTDDSPAIIQSFSDARIRVVSRPNKGLIDTLNEGLSLAACELVARHDADDFCMPQRLQRQYDFLIANPAYVLVGADVEYVDQNGMHLTNIRPGGYDNDAVGGIIASRNPFLHSAVIYRKSAVIAAGGYMRGALTFEDWILWVNMLRAGKMCNLPEVLEIVTLNPESVTIDERWRGAEFISLRAAALARGSIMPAEAARIKDIVQSQNTAAYKKASYNAIVAKKYLWDNPQQALARRHLRAAIGAWPGRAEPYLLWMMSWLPPSWIQRIYQRRKRSAA